MARRWISFSESKYENKSAGARKRRICALLILLSALRGVFSLGTFRLICTGLLDLLAVLPVEAEAEDVPEEAAPLDN